MKRGQNWLICRQRLEISTFKTVKATTGIGFFAASITH